MMQKAFKNMRLVQNQARLFSYNYQSASHPRVWLDVSRDGQRVGRLNFELYETHTPALAENFTAFATGQAQGHRSYVGTSLHSSVPGQGFQAGTFEGENQGSNNERLADENLELRHHKRGILTLPNDGPNSNGSTFMVTYDQANYLNGYQNAIGELVEGDDVLAQIEASSDRYGALSGEWTISAAGH